MAATMTTVAKPAEDQGTFLSRIPWYVQMAVILALTLLLIVAAHEMLFSDRINETNKIQQQTEDLRKVNANASIINQNLAATEQALKDKQEEIDKLRDLLPDQGVEISRVYDTIKDYMRSENLDLKVFKEDKTMPSDYYTAQPVKVQVVGQYDNLGRFFHTLEVYSRILSVTDLDIKQSADSAQITGRTITADFTIVVYYISPDNLDKLTMKKPTGPATKPAK